MKSISDQELRKISTGGDGVYIFDFSEIDAKYYKNFFETLINFSLENVITIGFTCDHYNSLPKESSKTNKIYLKSISQQINNYLDDCLSFLQHLFDESTILEHVILSNLKLSDEQLQILGNSINKSSSLRTLELKEINLNLKNNSNDDPNNLNNNNDNTNEKLQGLFSTINPNSICELILTNCSINDQNYGTVIQWIKAKQITNFPSKGLLSINITPPLNQENMEQINEAIQSINSIEEEDFGEEETILDDSVTFDSNEDIPNEEYFEKQSLDKKMTNEEMIEYNKKLRNKVNTLRQLIGIKSLEKGNMFLVGEGSAAFSQYLLSLQQKLPAIQKK